jgi:hypothetical protein
MGKKKVAKRSGLKRGKRKATNAQKRAAKKAEAKKAEAEASAAGDREIYRRLSDVEALVFEKLEAQHGQARAEVKSAQMLMATAESNLDAFMGSLNMRDRKKKPVQQFSIGRVDGVLCAMEPTPNA